MAGITTYKEIYDAAKRAKADLWDLAESRGRDVKLYLHWTAGDYYTNYRDYNISINAEGGLYLSDDDLSDVLDHTYYRNSGAIGITMNCAAHATPEDLGSYPPTKKQIDGMAKVICVLADALDLTIDKQHVLTHGEAADNEDGLDLYYGDYTGYENNTYGPKSNVDRWDLEFLGTAESPIYNPYDETGHRGGDIIRGKANYFRAHNFTQSVIDGKEMASDEVGPNGRPYAKNDINYLIKVGYTKEAAINLLSTVDKYTKPYDESMVAPNGMDYEKNDIDYLMNNGYTKEAAINLLKTTEKYKG